MFSRYRPSSLTLVLLAAWSSQAVVNTSTLRASPAEEADKAVVVEIAEVNAMTRAPLIDFARDVHPILTVKCLRCHGPEEAKNDFRVDDAATLLTYVEPRNVEGSSLWSDYLVTEDADMRMPPASIELDGQLTAVELATIKLWIEEGGMWNLEPEVSGRTEDAVATSLPGRI